MLLNPGSRADQSVGRISAVIPSGTETLAKIDATLLNTDWNVERYPIKKVQWNLWNFTNLSLNSNILFYPFLLTATMPFWWWHRCQAQHQSVPSWQLCASLSPGKYHQFVSMHSDTFRWYHWEKCNFSQSMLDWAFAMLEPFCWYSFE